MRNVMDCKDKSKAWRTSSGARMGSDGKPFKKTGDSDRWRDNFKKVENFSKKG